MLVFRRAWIPMGHVSPSKADVATIPPRPIGKAQISDSDY